MAQGPTVEFGGVFVVRETETALLCRIGDKSHWVAHSRLQPGSTVERPGDFGVLVLAWDLAVEFWDGAMSAKRRRPLCDGVRLDGVPCRVARLPGSRFCFSHDPTAATEPLAGLLAGKGTRPHGTEQRAQPTRSEPTIHRLPVRTPHAPAPSPRIAVGSGTRRCSGWSPKISSRRAEPPADMPRQAG